VWASTDLRKFVWNLGAHQYFLHRLSLRARSPGCSDWPQAEEVAAHLGHYS
jgi:hypothetical protein